MRQGGENKVIPSKIYQKLEDAGIWILVKKKSLKKRTNQEYYDKLGHQQDMGLEKNVVMGKNG